MKVLVIDDDFHIQRIVEDRLKAENFQVLKASDGIEGLRMLYDFHPDVILLDIMMPTIDGHAVLHCIKKDEKIKNIPVIMMTAKRERADVQLAAQNGAADYIVKPIDFRLMIKKIFEVSHAAPPRLKERPGEANIQAMAQDMANLSYEIDAVAASAGVQVGRPEPRTSSFGVSVDTSGLTAIMILSGAPRSEDMATVRSEIKRLTAVGMTKFVVDISGLQNLDLAEVMMLKDVMDTLSTQNYENRLVETDGKRRKFLRQCNVHMDHPLFNSAEEAVQSMA